MYLGGRPIVLVNGYGLFFIREKSGRSVKLSSYLHPAPRLGMWVEQYLYCSLNVHNLPADNFNFHRVNSFINSFSILSNDR